jgi:predicted nucleic acid-binding protein
MAGLSLDAGALIAAQRNERDFWAFLDQVISDGVVPQIPAGALAQAWRGGALSALLARLLKDCEVVSLDEDLAKESGELIARAKTRDAVDASVVASAARIRGTIVTSDPDDLRRLAQHVKGVRILDLRDVGKATK